MTIHKNEFKKFITFFWCFEWTDERPCTYGFVPNFDDSVLRRPAALPAEHAVQREAGRRRAACREGDLFAAAGTGRMNQSARGYHRWRDRRSLMTAPRIFVHLVMIEPSERVLRGQNDLCAAILFGTHEQTNVSLFRFLFLIIVYIKEKERDRQLPNSNGSAASSFDKDSWMGTDWAARSPRR